MIDKVKKYLKLYDDNRFSIRMAKALIAVDEILKEYIAYPKWNDGTYQTSEAQLADEIRKAIASTPKEKTG